MVPFLILLISLFASAASIDLGNEEQVVASSSLLQSHKHLTTSSDEPNTVASSCLLQTKEVKRQLPADAGADTMAAQEPAAESFFTDAAQEPAAEVVLADAEVVQADAEMANADCTIKGAIAPHEPIHNVSFAITYDDHTNGLQGLFVDPEHKFAFCLIEKNACSTWIRTVLQPLLYRNFSECKLDRPGARCKDGVDYGVSFQSQRLHGTEAIEKIFQDPTATRAVFVRDPMERFASAFMNKCVGISDSGKAFSECPVKSKVFRDFVEWLLRVPKMEDLEGHLLPQAYHCQLKRRIKGFNIVSAMSKETFTNDMNCVLARAGLDWMVKDSPSPMVNGAMSMLAPKEERPSPTDAITVMKKLFTKDAAKKLMAKYAVDYDLFGFSKEPAWLEEATGEWYNKEPHPALFIQTDSTEKHMDKDQSNSDSFANLESSWMDQDIVKDDLGELAVRSGYSYH